MRFGFELVENLCETYGTSIEMIDNTKKTEDQELVEDMIQILTVFSARLQGKRAKKAKKMIQELMEDDTFKESETIAYKRAGATTLEIGRNGSIYL